MTRKYVGGKSLDAEITLDFEKDEIQMDYSLNPLSSPYSSNTSCVLKGDRNFRRLGPINCVKKLFVFVFFVAYNTITTPIMAFLTERGFIKNKNYQVEHQRILKEIYTIVWGRSQLIFDTAQIERTIRIPLRTNIWCDYKMEGDYKDQIRKISLKRRFTNQIYFGKSATQQIGWELIFEFRQPPKNGSLIVEWI